MDKMLMGPLLHDLASNVRNLLSCDGAGLFLDCPEPVLRHPLLNVCFPRDNRPIIPAGSLVEAFALDAGERFWAVCDMAMQTGVIWGINHLELRGAHVGSMAAAPLKSAGGVLGMLLLLDRRPGAFQDGECRLIEQYLPAIGQCVEAALGDIYCPPAGRGMRDEVYAAEQESLEGAQQSEFISMVSHELRVPLAAIKGYTGLLQAFSAVDLLEGDLAGVMTEARQQQYLSRIMEQANHLEVLVGDLLDVSCIQAGRLALRYTSVDLAQTCQRVAQLVQHRVDQQQPGYYYIRCRIDAKLPQAWADSDRVQQVLNNLVENAVKYSPYGGSIEILAYTRRVLCPISLRPVVEEDYEHASERGKALSLRAGWKIYITVRDWGIGIPQQQQSSLFKPFTRLEHPATSHVHGVGLGLYISRKLVEAMDGRMMLKSHEGRGTSITFTLPTEQRVSPVY